MRHSQAIPCLLVVAALFVSSEGARHGSSLRTAYRGEAQTSGGMSGSAWSAGGLMDSDFAMNMGDDAWSSVGGGDDVAVGGYGAARGMSMNDAPGYGMYGGNTGIGRVPGVLPLNAPAGGYGMSPGMGAMPMTGNPMSAGGSYSGWSASNGMPLGGSGTGLGNRAATGGVARSGTYASGSSYGIATSGRDRTGMSMNTRTRTSGTSFTK